MATPLNILFNNDGDDEIHAEYDAPEKEQQKLRNSSNGFDDEDDDLEFTGKN